MDLDGSGSSSDPADQVVTEIQAAGGEAVPCFASVADRASATKFVRTALDGFGGLDIRINAGIADPDWFEGTDMDRFELRANCHVIGR